MLKVFFFQKVKNARENKRYTAMQIAKSLNNQL
jgi:hypothetical protein